MNQKSVKYSVWFLILFYAVGITGFVIPQTHSFFKSLTPFALLMSAGFLVWFHRPAYTTKTLLVFVVIFMFSFLAEMVGVQTGSIFGHYIYGESLGLKILETPLIIGLNWLMLIYCTKVIADRLTNNEKIKPFTGAFLMVFYDLVLEQAAPKLDMWSWEGGTIPVQNYVAWFVFAFFFHLMIRKAKVEFKNPLAIPVYLIQFFFFIILVIYFLIRGL